MSLEKKEIFALRHYFRNKPLQCTLVSGDTNSFFTAGIKEKITVSNQMYKGDPIIFGFLLENGTLEFNGGSIIAISENGRDLIIAADKTANTLERRQYERFPLSLHARCRANNTMETRDAYIKDLSYSGFRIYTDLDLNTQDTIELDIYDHNNVFNLTGLVIRKTTCYSRNEYGIQIVYTSKSTISTTKDFLDKLQLSEKELIRRYLLSI